jgi:dTDP-4-amino-4,6-dideoxygalactose transaminase
MCPQIRDDHNVLYKSKKNKTCPHEILDALNEINAEGRPIWKPMHMQPLFHRYPFITCTHLGEDLFRRGLCLPSDNKMTPEVQDYIIDVIRACFE